MKRSTSTMIAALMTAGLSTAAFAETKVETNAGTDTVDAATVGVTAQSGVADTDTAAGADANADVTASNDMGKNGKNKLAKENYGQVISDLRSNSQSSADITAEIDSVTAESETTFTTVGDLRGNAGDEAEALDNALDAKSDMVMDLQTALNGNADLKSKIEAEGYSVDQVIAVSTKGSGGVTLVVDDRM